MYPTDATDHAGPLSPESIEDDQGHNSDAVHGLDVHGRGTPIKSETDDSIKKLRLGRACDPCSIRKTKCDQSKPCGPCHSLAIPCTFDRPKRRRGPPNRLAAAIKREHDAKRNSTITSDESISPNYSDLSTAPSLSAELIGPIELIERLLDDYFMFIYPTSPFPHETSFREHFRARKDRQDQFFLAQLSAMIGVVVAVCPRLPRKRLKQLQLENLYPTAGLFVQRCLDITLHARGTSYLLKDDLGAIDAATSFCLFAICGSTYRFLQADLYGAEAYSITQALFARQTSSAGAQDLLEEEMTRRIFWAVFILIRSGIAWEGGLARVPIKPPSLYHRYPPHPHEIDDEHIWPDRIDPQPVSTVARIRGFCASIRLCQIYDPLVKLEDSYDPDRHGFMQEQMRVLADCIQQLRTFMPTLPSDLITWSLSSSQTPLAYGQNLRFPATAQAPMPSTIYHPMERLEAANEIQKSFINITYLSTRSYLAERYYTLLKRQKHDITGHANVREWIRNEREFIARELLKCLNNVRPIHIEPNGTVISLKIRQISTTLMPDEDQKIDGASDDEVKLASDVRLQQYLAKFVDLLSALERGLNGPISAPAEAMDQAEEMDLRNWASLREHQLEYAKAIGAAPG